MGQPSAQTTHVGFGDLSLIGCPAKLKGGPDVSFSLENFSRLWLGLAVVLALKIPALPLFPEKCQGLKAGPGLVSACTEDVRMTPVGG